MPRNKQRNPSTALTRWPGVDQSGMPIANQVAAVAAETVATTPPMAHHATHENGGSDEVSVAGLSGVLADPQPPIIGAGATQAVAGNDARLTNARTPTAHETTHRSGGSDALSVLNLAGYTGDTTKFVRADATLAVPAGGAGSGDVVGPASAVNTDVVVFDGTTGKLVKDSGVLIGNVVVTSDSRLSDARTPTAHHTSHEAGGADVVIIWTVISNTATGATNNWAPAGLSGNTLIEWNGAADAAITGLAGGTTGQMVTIKNVTSAKVATFAHQSGSSSAGNKFTNPVTSAPMPIAAGGYASYQYDGTDWQQVGFSQGAAIAAVYNSAYFGASAGGWTVDAGDVQNYEYIVTPGYLWVWCYITATTVPGTPVRLDLDMAAIGNFTIANSLTATSGWGYDNGTAVTTLCQTFGGGTASFPNTIGIFRFDLGTWASAVNLSQVRFTYAIPIS